VGLERRKRVLATLVQSIEIGMEDVVRKNVMGGVVVGGDGEVGGGRIERWMRRV